MAARAAFSPAGSEGVSGLSPDWPDAFASVALSLSLSATGGRLTGGFGFGRDGTGGRRPSTGALCAVAVGPAGELGGPGGDPRRQNNTVVPPPPPPFNVRRFRTGCRTRRPRRA